jgi:integrase
VALLVECPRCRNRNSLKVDKCKCGFALKKFSGKTYWIEFYDETGKRRRERIGSSKEAAEHRLREVLRARTEGRHIEKDGAVTIRLKELADWYEKLPEVIAKRSFTRDKKSIKKLLEGLRGDTKIKDITPGKVDAYRQHRLQTTSTRYPGQTIKPATVNREIACLKSMLSKAVRHGLIRENPLLRYRMLEEHNVRMVVLDEASFERLLDACPQHLRPVVAVGFYLGLRKSEVVNLTWNEVDLKDEFIRLDGSRTKNGTARSIPIHPEVLAIFKNLPRGLHTDRVFLNNGKPIKEFKNAYASACKTAGLDDLTFHDLRHCAINNLRLAGNDFLRIMAISGHKTMSVFKRYNVVTEEELKKVNWKTEAAPMDTNMDTKADSK